jgi:hypothetical protein
LGRAHLSRRRYFDAADGSDTPLDRLIDEADRVITLGVRELACRLGIDSASFRRAAENLKGATGLSISPEQLRQLVEQEGRWLSKAQKDEQLELDFAASDCQTTARPDGQRVSRMYIGMDGVKVPVVTDAEKQRRRQQAQQQRKNLPRRKGVRRRPLPAVKAGADQAYKEFKIVLLYDQSAERRYVRATRKDHEHAGRLLGQAAAQVRLRAAQETVGIADGADWIWNQMRRHVPWLNGQVLDFYHLSQHVHEARRELFGSDEKAGQGWAEDLLHTVKHEGYEPFWEQLVSQRAGLRSPGKREALDDLMHYVAARRGLLAYPRCQQNGWDIGSGPTESMCKALTRRLKQRGMRWDSDNAEAIMALEALEQSDGWAAWHRFRAGSSN